MFGFGGCCCRPVAPVMPMVADGRGAAIIAIAILILIALAVIF
jgi:hypothetical protein